jgi:hypothetical protein
VFGDLPPLTCPNRGRLTCINPGFTLPNPAAQLGSTQLRYNNTRGQTINLLDTLHINSVIDW